jgi:DNA ligase D-like protein (predicted 3'-phosphoesterase)
MNSKLEKYQKKRDFNKTKEPSGVETKNNRNIFVVQKHDASNLHYDFRLEINGVLVSWAVPKGPSLNPAVKRLAVPTEDHPLAYADFEGTIPEGQYGAGTVMIWDKGKFENIKNQPLDKGKEKGQIEVKLQGEKLKGNFSLVRFRNGRTFTDEKWLLIKMNDDFADRHTDILKQKPDSVISGKRLEEITN